MKTVRYSVLVLAAAVAGCGGNYSNDDIAFLNALPHREDLQAKAPDKAGTNQSGLQSRRDGLAAGDVSDAYVKTKGASDQFNLMMEFFLGIVDAVRKYPPTSRTDKTRTWGPFKDDKHPAFDVQMVMERDGDQFSWKIEFRSRAAAKDAPWLKGLDGKFLATGGARKGKGELHLYAHTLRVAGLTGADDDGKLAEMDATYVTDSLPVQIDMQLAGEPTSDWKSIDYSYREFEPGVASMVFTGTAPPPKTGVLDIRSGWTRSGAGKAKMNFDDGTTKLSGFECWDASFHVTYFSEPWLTPASGGDPFSCAEPQGI